MLKKLGAAIAAATALCATSASAALILDFEEFEIGDTISAGWGADLGSPYPFVDIIGTIVADPAGGNNKVLKILTEYPAGKFPYNFILYSRYRVDQNTVFTPTVISFDTYLPEGGVYRRHDDTLPIDAAEWITVPQNEHVGGVAQERRLQATSAYIDNIRYEIGYGAVPEPASWALLIAGFGSVGVSLRTLRRRALAA